MKKCMLIVAFLGFVTIQALSQDRGFGLGVMFGEPTGLSFKDWLSQRSAIDGGLAWSFENKAALNLHADYLMHDYSLAHVEEGQLPFYYGLGLRLKLESNTKFSVRIPLGFSYQFAHDPLDIFFEIVPMLNLVPSTAFDLNGGIGIRYYFGQK
jgi:hypothetical protein